MLSTNVILLAIVMIGLIYLYYNKNFREGATFAYYNNPPVATPGLGTVDVGGNLPKKTPCYYCRPAPAMVTRFGGAQSTLLVGGGWATCQGGCQPPGSKKSGGTSQFCWSDPGTNVMGTMDCGGDGGAALAKKKFKITAACQLPSQNAQIPPASPPWAPPLYNSYPGPNSSGPSVGTCNAENGQDRGYTNVICKLPDCTCPDCGEAPQNHPAGTPCGGNSSIKSCSDCCGPPPAKCGDHLQGNPPPNGSYNPYLCAGHPAGYESPLTENSLCPGGDCKKCCKNIPPAPPLPTCTASACTGLWTPLPSAGNITCPASGCPSNTDTCCKQVITPCPKDCPTGSQSSGDANCSDETCSNCCSKIPCTKNCPAGEEWGSVCPACVPNCSIAECGDDGCEGTCGTCTNGKSCQGGICQSTCTPACNGNNCGDDGCGGSCGSCSGTATCVSGKCTCPQYYTGLPDCNTLVCSPACSSHGTCTLSSNGVPVCVCNNGWVGTSCDKQKCVPNCTGKSCGDDGCGGSCGTCTSPVTSPTECINGTCQPQAPTCPLVSVTTASGKNLVFPLEL